MIMYHSHRFEEEVVIHCTPCKHKLYCFYETNKISATTKIYNESIEPIHVSNNVLRDMYSLF